MEKAAHDNHSTWDAKYHDLFDETNSLKVYHGNLLAQYRDLNLLHEQLQTQYDGLQEVNLDMSAEIMRLDDTQKTDNERYTQLQNQYVHLQQSNLDLATQLLSLEDTERSLNEAIADLTAKQRELVHELENSYETNKIATRDLDILTGQYNDVNTTHFELAGELGDLERNHRE